MVRSRTGLAFLILLVPLAAAQSEAFDKDAEGDVTRDRFTPVDEPRVDIVSVRGVADERFLALEVRLATQIAPATNGTTYSYTMVVALSDKVERLYADYAFTINCRLESEPMPTCAVPQQTGFNIDHVAVSASRLFVNGTMDAPATGLSVGAAAAALDAAGAVYAQDFTPKADPFAPGPIERPDTADDRPAYWPYVIIGIVTAAGAALWLRVRR